MSFVSVLSFALFFFLTSCHDQPPQNGHQLIAMAVRSLLDRSYAGIEYPAYRDGLKEVEAVVTQQLEHTPHHLRSTAAEMLTYLRTAEEVLRWQTEHGHSQTVDTALVATWLARHPFLRAAIGAQTDSVFDVSTALILLWDQTSALMPSFQVKSNSL